MRNLTMFFVSFSLSLLNIHAQKGMGVIENGGGKGINENELKGCSGCIVTEPNEWHVKKTSYGRSTQVVLGTMQITDHSLEECTPLFTSTINLTLTAFIKPWSNECNNKATDCSAIKCEGDILYLIRIEDNSGEGCAVKGSKLRIIFREKAGKSEQELTSDIIYEKVKNTHLVRSFALFNDSFEQHCGDTNGVDLPVITVQYKTNNSSTPEKVVPFTINPIDVACSPCAEPDSSNYRLKQKTSTSLSVFPNPILDNLNVVFYSPTNTKATLRIMNLLGQTVVETEHQLVFGKNHIKVNLETLKKGGAYFYQFTVDGKLHKGRFIKQAQ